MQTITVGAGSPINYQYDYTGQRVNYESNGMTKHYLYDGLTLIAQTNTIGNTIARYHYGDRYQLAETRNNTNSYYHVDSMGTNVAVTNQGGSIQARYEYDAYGNVLSQENPGLVTKTFGFTGYQEDDETGLYYANARYYDSATARFNREDPLSGNPEIPPSLHRYNYAYSNPTRFIDPDGKYAEDGHYYTTLIVAEALGFTAEQVNTLALYSQLPDEVDNLDATELVKNKTLSMLFAGCIHCYRANEYLPFLHSLNGGKSEIETNRTIQAIIANRGDMRAIGFLIHRLGDTFAHRKFGDEKNLYGRGIGHALDGHDPDVIQQRPDLYNDYVQTLISTLAQIKGGISDAKLKRITQKVLAKTNKFSSAPLKKWQTTRYGKYGNPIIINHQSVSNKDLTETSIKEARRIVIEEISFERKQNGKEPINGNYQPENVGVSNFFGMDVWLSDALNYYVQIKNKGKYNPFGLVDSLGIMTNKAKRSLEKAKKILEATPGVSLTEAEESNKALILIEGDDNNMKLKEDSDG